MISSGEIPLIRDSRLGVSGTQQAILLWDPALWDITFDTVDITNALDVAVRYETVGATGIVLA